VLRRDQGGLMGLDFRGRFGMRIRGRRDMVWAVRVFSFVLRDGVVVYNRTFPCCSLSRPRGWQARHASNQVREQVSAFSVGYQNQLLFDGCILS
jgi:hypothetical protein